MTLPYDVARCEGMGAKESMCKLCRRTEKGDPTRQWHITPMAYLDNCCNYIPPVESRASDKNA